MTFASGLSQFVRRHLLLLVSIHVGLLGSLLTITQPGFAIGAGFATGLLFYASLSFGYEGYQRLAWASHEIRVEGFSWGLVADALSGFLRLIIFSFAGLIVFGYLLPRMLQVVGPLITR